MPRHQSVESDAGGARLSLSPTAAGCGIRWRPASWLSRLFHRRPEACPGDTPEHYRVGMSSSNPFLLVKRKHDAYGDSISSNLLVRNVPTDIHQTLVRRAQGEGKSLQEYVMGLLKESTGKPTMAEVMAEIEANLAAHPRPSINTEEIVAGIREGREERTRRLLG